YLYTSLSFATSGLTEGTDGNFYGVAQNAVFRFTPDGVWTPIFPFWGGPSDDQGLVQAGDGNFYGVTFYGGAHDKGTVFKLSIPLEPAFQSVRLEEGSLNLTWSAVAGQTYQLQTNPVLSSTGWGDFGSAAVATNGIMEAFDSTGANPANFYRIVLLP